MGCVVLAGQCHFSYSLNDSDYTSVPDLHLASPTTADSLGFVSNSLGTTFTGLSVASNSFIYLRWNGSDISSGNSARDEFALDNITLKSFTFAGTAPLTGDVDQNGAVNTADIQSLMTALTDMPAYAAAHPALSTTQVSFVLDVNQDSHVNSADIQALIVGLANGTLGSSHLVVAPEPPAFNIALLGAMTALLFVHCRHEQRPEQRPQAC